MPELPEVESVRRSLEPLVVGKTIERVVISYTPLVVTGAEHLRQKLTGQTVMGLGRRGKYLIFELTDGLLISHLRMEGKYLMFSKNGTFDKHCHVFFHLSDGQVLIYHDVRKFGTMEYLAKGEEEAYFASKKLGPEPNEQDFQLPPFVHGLEKSKKKIKPHLLDQTLVAGLGNIYVDEVLWAAQLHPERLSQSLSLAEIESLHGEIIRVLQLGIEKGGSSIRTYKNALGMAGSMQDYLQVYGKQGQPCSRCMSPIAKIKVQGRGTHLCPQCQKE
ncbi:DNA-formamidopyrimidine glycosylase [Streptococcus cuniculipharyngis]|uniref:Formamidopyrimidine-DNA glycosylase n=1 Tax=Streptococcus cuniculipharyngis TaxID=1562651 RepID=A0A5C5SGH1_9STRE|nr:DNA-formamidopyrimidine glycosylase [Streptococcus cuniculipharyngis]TWS99233.1 DNA-formamidopyrimidine glycosylase [Streptococcus cuniculipharyngis]